MAFAQTLLFSELKLVTDNLFIYTMPLVHLLKTLVQSHMLHCAILCTTMLFLTPWPYKQLLVLLTQTSCVLSGSGTDRWYGRVYQQPTLWVSTFLQATQSRFQTPSQLFIYSGTDTIGDQHFAPYSEVSLTQGLPVYFWKDSRDFQNRLFYRGCPLF